MYRLLVGALAAVVGFSFGNAVPKWIENRGKNVVPAAQPPPLPQQQAPARRTFLRRKPFRRFKFSRTRCGREAQVTETHADLCVDGKPLDAKNSARLIEKEDIFLVCGPESTSGTEDDATGAAAHSCWKSRVGLARIAKSDKIEAPLLKHNASAPAAAKVSLKLQVQEWKSKLTRLKNKALANEKLWCDKYEKPTLEQNFMGERVSCRRPEARDWEDESLKKPSTHETELEQDDEKAPGLLQEESRKSYLHSVKEFARKPPEFKELFGMRKGANKQEISPLNTSVARSQRREYTFAREKRKGDTSRLDLRHALVEGRKAELER